MHPQYTQYSPTLHSHCLAHSHSLLLSLSLSPHSHAHIHTHALSLSLNTYLSTHTRTRSPHAVAIQFLEIGGDHLDLLMQPEREALSREHLRMAARSRSLLNTCRKTVYFVNAASIFDCVRCVVNADGFIRLLSRMRWLSQVFASAPDHHQILLYVSHLAPIRSIAPAVALASDHAHVGATPAHSTESACATCSDASTPAETDAQELYSSALSGNLVRRFAVQLCALLATQESHSGRESAPPLGQCPPVAQWLRSVDELARRPTAVHPLALLLEVILRYSSAREHWHLSFSEVCLTNHVDPARNSLNAEEIVQTVVRLFKVGCVCGCPYAHAFSLACATVSQSVSVLVCLLFWLAGLLWC
jgi:hypothetical protein